MTLTNAAISNLWIKRRFTIAASATITVDTFPVSNFDHVQYICYAQDVADTLSKSFQFQAHHKAGTSLKDVLYGMMGDSIDIDVDTAISAGDYELNITNNEAFSVEFSFARLKLF